MSLTSRRVLVLGGGDVGSAVAHLLFRCGLAVLICDRALSPHARRGMAFTDALFDGSAMLEGVRAQWLPDLAGVASCWAEGSTIPIVTLPDGELVEALRFDVIIDATMRRNRVPTDLRPLASCALGLGPGYAPGVNCHIAIETQWGPAMGSVLRDHPAAERGGGPHPLEGMARERFASAPMSGTWHTQASLGQTVCQGDALGDVDGFAIRAPINGCLRGVAHDGVSVLKGQILLEVDPRATPQIHGLGERPRAIAQGVAMALDVRQQVTVVREKADS